MRYLLISFFLFIGATAFSQISDSFNLKWEESTFLSPEGENIPIITFTNASITKNNNWLPEFFHLHKIGSTGENFAIELVDTQFEQLSSSEEQILRNKSLSNKITLHSQSVTIRKNVYQQIRFVPLRRNQLSGKIEKLTHFKIKFSSQGRTKATSMAKSYVANSVLSSGTWVKIAVDTTAIHKISYSQLLNMGFSQPEQVRIYGFGGGMLPKMNSEPSPDDLPLLPVYFHKGDDGVFNNGDYLLFYAKGPRKWSYQKSQSEFVHENHLYTKKAYYFITNSLGASPQISVQNSTSSPNTMVQSFDDYRVIDIDETNLIQSGRLWLGQEFDVNTEYDYNFNFPDLEIGTPIKITASVLARSSSGTKFEISSASTAIGEISIPAVNTSSYTANYASLKEQTFNSFTPNTEQFDIHLNYKKNSASSIGWLNYLRINARCNLVFSGSQMAFRDRQSVQNGNITQFNIQNCNSSTLVWDVSDLNAVVQMNFQVSGTNGNFSTSTNTLKEFVVFDPNGSFPEVEIVGNVPNQNLHALAQADLLIVSPKQFLSYAYQIADFHQNQDNLRVNVVDQAAIFNEFSSGAPDVAAIRNFVKMFYDRANSESELPKYLLLIGDGSYDNLSEQESNTNKILTYQSENSLSPTQSFVTDDFYGLLDDDEGEATGLVDIGIGRLPVNTAEEAQIVTSKITSYYDSELGDWRNAICFIGDDEDNNTHMRDANKLATQVEENHPEFRVQRIFLDNYEQITTSAGQEYPDVNTEISESVNKGTLIMNYTGHGNENGLAHEHILMIDDINGWQNPSKLPLFMTATCEFSRFDNYKKLSAGEIILLRQGGGGIGLFTTTRLVFSSPNFSLNQNFYNFVFERDANGNFNRLGDVMRLTKNATSSGINKRNFTLLGDPALRLNYPVNQVISTKLNDMDITQQKDTLKALSEIKISGKLSAFNGSDLNDFNGTIYPTIFDKAMQKSTKGNDGTPFEYTEQSNVIYKGKASVSNGKFEFSFFVPKDINYQYGNGKISYYASGNKSDASGYNNSIVVGGTNPDASNDNTGPIIAMYMNDEHFTEGGLTNANPLFLATVQDSSGINTLGNSIGHNITAVLDDKEDESIELNDFYEADLDSYKKGKISYQFSDLETGEHHIQLKVWDNVNNSSVEGLDFLVAESADLVIKHVLNYPNPFTTNTGFYFEHNQAMHELDVLIQILTVSGKLIKSIETSITPSGNLVGPIKWDGKDDFGNSIGRGVYLYRVKVRADNGKIANKFQKLVILK